MQSMHPDDMAEFRAAIARTLNEGSPFEAPVFHLPRDEYGSIIIAIDAQKPWETTTHFGKRVLGLLEDKPLSKTDPILTCRVFLGGLRPKLMYEVFKMKGDAYEITFEKALSHVRHIEIKSNDDNMKVLDTCGCVPPKWREMVRPGRESVLQDGLEFFGETNDFVEAFYYNKSNIKLQILYRR